MSAPSRPARSADLARLARLAELDDVDLGVRLLRGTPTNEGRPGPVLRAVSESAQAFGAGLSSRAGGRDFTPTVVERTGGLGDATTAPVVARYLPRAGRVELFTDVVAHCEAVVAALGWRDVFPAGSVRAAALAHEEAHELVAHRHSGELRRAVGVPAVRLGRWTRWAHVAGAHELAAHAYAQAVLRLPRSPLLITTAAVLAVEDRLPVTTSVEED